MTFARNPAHPDWYRITIALYHYVHGRYDEALAEAKRVNQPNVVFPHVNLAMIYGQTSRRADAAYEVGEILRLEPEFGAKASSEFERRNINPATIAMILDGLQKAGLAITPQRASGADRCVGGTIRCRQEVRQRYRSMALSWRMLLL